LNSGADGTELLQSRFRFVCSSLLVPEATGTGKTHVWLGGTRLLCAARAVWRPPTAKQLSLDPRR
jgi:hypothetical protein